MSVKKNAAALALIGAAVLAASAVSRAAAGDPCLELAHAKSFSFGRIVELEKEVSYGRSFAHVLASPDAEHCFREILKSENIEAKMFSLVALREIDAALFNVEVQRMRNRDFNVVTLVTQERGVVERQSGDTVLRQISDGVFQPAFRFYKTHRVPQQKR